jgi:type I restriction enzyme S subunit
VLQQKQVKNRGMIESTVLSLSYGRIVVKPPEKLHGLVPESFETYQIVEPGNIIIRPTDLQNDKNTIRVGIARDRGIITSAYLCFGTSEPLNAQYAHLLLLGYDLKKVFYGMGSGLRQNLDWSDFKRLPVLLPPAKEQMAIVAYANQIDRRINRFIRNRRRLIEVLNEQKQAIINRAVTQGRDPDVPLKPSGIDWLGDIPKHWRAVRLKYVSRVQTGITLGKNYMGQKVEERPYIRVANVQTGRLDLRMVKTVAVPPSEIMGSELKPGDVLMTEGGDIDKLGRGCVWQGEIEGCLHQNHIFAVRPNQSRLLPDYLVALMGSRIGRIYFQLTAKQTTNLASTNSSTLGAFPLVLPEPNEQKRILDAIAKETLPLDAAVNRAQREIDLIREYRTRLIADVVTGKVDVRHLAPSPAVMAAEAAPEDLDEDLGDETPVEDDAGLSEEVPDADD